MVYTGNIGNAATKHGYFVLGTSVDFDIAKHILLMLP